MTYLEFVAVSPVTAEITATAKLLMFEVDFLIEELAKKRFANTAAPLADVTFLTNAYTDMATKA